MTVLLRASYVVHNIHTYVQRNMSEKVKRECGLVVFMYSANLLHKLKLINMLNNVLKSDKICLKFIKLIRFSFAAKLPRSTAFRKLAEQKFSA